VAVVQISRIQVRRGRENADAGVPQLAGGEFAWAVDTQSLYIGNGAVSEGAPSVGNTKILTEADDIFSLTNAYQYGKLKSYITTGSDLDRPVKRSLQNRLDDIVSVLSFGAQGNGTSDDTASLQRAIDQLFLNSATVGTENSRIKLFLPAGVYKITDTLFLPPFVSIIGDGKEKTVIKNTSNNAAIKTIDSSLDPAKTARDDEQFTNGPNQANQIRMEGITIRNDNNTIGLFVNSCKDSVFKDIGFEGPWITTDGDVSNNYAIYLQQKSQVITTNNNVFESITISGFARGLNADDEVKDNKFSNSVVHNVKYGIVLGNSPRGIPGSSNGPQNNTIFNNLFRLIENQAIWVALGTGNISNSNRFEDGVGYLGGDASSVNKTSVISFDNPGNDSVNDSFLRSKELGTDLNYINAPYVPEITGNVISTIAGQQKVGIGNTNSTFLDLFRLGGTEDSVYEVDYIFSSNDKSKFTRKGKLTITLNKNDLNTSSSVSLTDDYDYSGPSNFEESLVFSARYNDGLETIFIEYFCDLLDNAQNLVYKVKIIS
jgi:hypothetical protein